MVWVYLLGAIGLIAAVIFGVCVAMDYLTYIDLQRRLLEEQKRRLEESQISGFT
jgi:hypothetical protein